MREPDRKQGTASLGPTDRSTHTAGASGGSVRCSSGEQSPRPSEVPLCWEMRSQALEPIFLDLGWRCCREHPKSDGYPVRQLSALSVLRCGIMAPLTIRH